MIISVSDAPPGSLTAWDALRTSLSQMSTHAYLPWSAQQRALALLRELAVVARRTRCAGRHALAVCAAAASHDVVAVVVSGTCPCPMVLVASASSDRFTALCLSACLDSCLPACLSVCHIWGGSRGHERCLPAVFRL